MADVNIKQKRIRIAILVMALLLALNVVALTVTLVLKAGKENKGTSVSVPDNIITSSAEITAVSQDSPSADSSSMNTPDAETAASTASGTSDQTEEKNATLISLYNTKPEDNTPFKVTNMFPGDNETKYYCVEVSHKADTELFFKIDVRDGYEKLAEVLKFKVTLMDSGKVVYDGTAENMTQAVSRMLYADNETSTKIYYEINAYLDTSVGNEYQSKDLIADFKWWIEDEEALSPPKTGDSRSITVWLVIGGASLLFILILIILKKRTVTNDEVNQNDCQ